jgi:hypothetical protein
MPDFRTFEPFIPLEFSAEEIEELRKQNEECHKLIDDWIKREREHLRLDEESLKHFWSLEASVTAAATKSLFAAARVGGAVNVALDLGMGRGMQLIIGGLFSFTQAVGATALAAPLVIVMNQTGHTLSEEMLNQMIDRMTAPARQDCDKRFPAPRPAP